MVFPAIACSMRICNSYTLVNAQVFLPLLLFLVNFQEQFQIAAVGPTRVSNSSLSAAVEKSRMLANTLAQNGDPKFQVILYNEWILGTGRQY